MEVNLARKGLWRSASAPGTGGGELVRLLDATDRLGLAQRIDAGNGDILARGSAQLVQTLLATSSTNCG